MQKRKTKEEKMEKREQKEMKIQET